LSTISSVAEIPTRIRALFYNQQANSAGCYLIRFFVNGLVKGVMVDDHLLFDDHNMQVFCKSVNNEMWVPILEKAFAKLIGSYTRIDGAF
jgi:calpain-15